MTVLTSFGRANLLAAAAVALCMSAAPAVAEYVKPRVDPTHPHPPPDYPASAEAHAEEGTVKLSLKISAAGRVRGVKITQSSGYPDLDDAAVMSAITWHYLPASQNGENFSDEMSLAIKYQLPAAPQAETAPATQASVKQP